MYGSSTVNVLARRGDDILLMNMAGNLQLMNFCGVFISIIAGYITYMQRFQNLVIVSGVFIITAFLVLRWKICYGNLAEYIKVTSGDQNNVANPQWQCLPSIAIDIQQFMSLNYYGLIPLLVFGCAAPTSVLTYVYCCMILMFSIAAGININKLQAMIQY